MKHYLNVCDVNGAEVDPVDVITFGSPCQDLSVAGKRAGLKHESNGDDETTRSGLFMEAVRIIKEMREKDGREQLRSGRADGHIRPRFAVWENVPGAFSSNRGEDFRVVLEELARIKDAEVSIPLPEKGKWKQSGEIVGNGWSIAWRTLDAQYHGVPQRRRRIFLVADFADECAGEILFECQGLPGYSSQSSEKGQGTSGDSSESIGRTGERECNGVIFAIDQQGGKGTANYSTNVMPTLCSDSHGTPHAVAIPYTLQIRSGCEGGGKGSLIQTDKSAYLTATQTQTLFQPVCIQGSMIGRKDENGPQGNGINVDKAFTLNTIDRHAVAYGICSYASNSMKSDNPHSGIYEADTSRTLDLNGGNPACNQGGICICEPVVMDMTHANDVLRIYEDGIVPYLQHRMGTGGNQIPLVAEPKGYAMQAIGECADVDSASSLKQRDYKDATDSIVEKITYSIKDEGFMDFAEEVAATLKARDYKMPQAVCYEDDFFVKYIVRRLTPTECARLQGMPDLWCRLSQIDDMSDEDYEFWKQAHKTYAEINGKAYKEKSKEQMIAWYNKLQVDSSEYKAYGNGMALPCVRVPIHGIAQHGAKTMASLFDGIGGFPLAGLIDGIKTLWTSEIELFPIAVTMERFREFEKYGCFTFGYEGSNANLSIEKEKKQMELRMEEYQLPDKISFNFEELKQELTEKVSHYETLVYTDDQIKEAKEDRANLNKLKKALNDERIRREKEYMVPFNAFKEQVSEIIKIIDKPVAVIDKQVKAYEDKQKQDKMAQIKALWAEQDVPEGLTLEEVFQDKFLNASCSMKTIGQYMTDAIDRFNRDMATLANLPEFGFEAQQVYISTLDLNKALAEGQRMAQIQKQKAEREEAMRKIEEEQKAKAAEEARKATFPDDAMNPPISEEEIAQSKQEYIEAAPAKQWISFAALLSTEDALALKDFFNSRNIEFKAV